MKQLCLILSVVSVIALLDGCTRIVKMEPCTGLPGTPVWIKSDGMWGNPDGQCIKWDGKTICRNFPGSFTVPGDCRPGKHKVTLVDNIDSSELFLVFPLFRLRHNSASFVVLEQ